MLLVCEEIAEYCFLKFPSYYYYYYYSTYSNMRKNFLNSLFTINCYSYFIEILQYDRKNCNLGCLNDL